MTIIPVDQFLSFEEFLQLELEESGRYELIDGEVVRFLPTRRHEDLADDILRRFEREVERLNLNYRVSGRIVIRTVTSQGKEQGRHPDVTVVDKTLWESQPTAYAALVEPPQLVVEVVSTNWEDDYLDKLEEYARLGIPEYWIVDYLAVASRSYLGNPKMPTVFVYLLDDEGVYQKNAYRNGDRILSRTFPELSLTAENILA